MRTSNKILLGSFIGVVVILVSIHLSLYAKYKKGDFIVKAERIAERYNTQLLPGVKYISVTGLDNFNIISSDTLKLETEKNHPSVLRFKVEGETLVISGDTLIKRNSFEDRRRTGTQVNLHLPSFIKLKIDFCEVKLQGNPDSTSAKSYDLELTETTINLGDEHFEFIDSMPSKFWKQLNITASKGSSVRLFPNAKLSGMNLSLNASSLQDNNSDIGQLSLQTDDKSTLNLSGANIKRLNLTPKQ